MRFFLLVLVVLIIGCERHTEKDADQSSATHSVVVKTIELTKKINQEQIQTLDSSQLRLLRNEIFARKGYRFESPEMSGYFSGFDWYNPTFDQVEISNHLTPIDNHNIELIRVLEKERIRVKNRKSDEITFINYLSLIPPLELPLKYVCDEGFKTPELNYDDSLIKHFKPEGAAVIGKLYQTAQEAALIYGYPADIFFPIVKIYDLTGKELEEIRLFKLIECVGDMGYSAKTVGVINKDFTVSAITTIIECDTEEMNQCDTTRYSNDHVLKY
ncbi:MAG: YARHG domain-containing protein [Bacteroidota bacterium]